LFFRVPRKKTRCSILPGKEGESHHPTPERSKHKRRKRTPPSLTPFLKRKGETAAVLERARLSSGRVAKGAESRRLLF